MGDRYFVPATYPETILTVQITASITCILSLFGASLIILTYAAFKDLRTFARQLLVNLSVADIVLCLSHFVGLFANNKRFLPHYNQETWNISTTDPLCITQGAITVYSTLASFLWSMLIAVYLIVLMIFRRPLVVKILVPLFYCISWGVPMIVVIVLGVNRYFGFEPVAAAGWCYTVKKNTTAGLAGDILSYEVWVYICFGVLTVSYLIIFIYIRCKKVRSKRESVKKYTLKGDLKLLFVPIIFVLLRVWSTVIDIGLHHLSENDIQKFQESKATAVFTVFTAIGLNAQGFANAILFCLFTKEVRIQLSRTPAHLRYCCSHWRAKCQGQDTINDETYLEHERLQDESSSIQLDSSVTFRDGYGT